MGDVVFLSNSQFRIDSNVLPPCTGGALAAIRVMSRDDGVRLWNYLLRQSMMEREDFFGTIWKHILVGESYPLRTLVQSNRVQFFDEIFRALISTPQFCFDDRLQVLHSQCNDLVFRAKTTSTHDIFECLAHLLRAHILEGGDACEHAYRFTGKAIGYIIRVRNIEAYPHLLVDSVMDRFSSQKTG